MKVAESLKRFRKTFNLTQKQVAETLGIKQPSYQIYESTRDDAETFPSTKIILKLADTYDVTTDYLLGRSDEPRPPKLDEKTLALVKSLQEWQAGQVPAQ